MQDWFNIRKAIIVIHYTKSIKEKYHMIISITKYTLLFRNKGKLFNLLRATYTKPTEKIIN